MWWCDALVYMNRRKRMTSIKDSSYVAAEHVLRLLNITAMRPHHTSGRTTERLSEKLNHFMPLPVSKSSLRVLITNKRDIILKMENILFKHFITHPSYSLVAYSHFFLPWFLPVQPVLPLSNVMNIRRLLLFNLSVSLK